MKICKALILFLHNVSGECVCMDPNADVDTLQMLTE